MGPVGVILGAFLWWQFAKGECGSPPFQSQCVTTAEGTAYSWMALASQQSSFIFGFFLAGIAVIAVELLIYAQRHGVLPLPQDE